MLKSAESLLQLYGDPSVLDAVRHLTAPDATADKLAEVTQVRDTTLFAVRESVAPFVTFTLPNGELLEPRAATRIKRAMLPAPMQGSQQMPVQQAQQAMMGFLPAGEGSMPPAGSRPREKGSETRL